MKKSLSLFVLVLVFFFASTKDSDAQFKLGLGPLTGMNFNILTGSDLNDTYTGFGFVFGSQLDMSLTPVLGILAQVQFYDNMSGSNSVTGQLAALNGAQGTLDEDLSFAYFMIEPLLKLNLPGSGMYFLAGPAIGFNIQSSYTDTYTVQNGQRIPPQKGSIKNTNVRFAVMAGAGYDIRLSSLMTLAPQFTFGFGITNLIQDVSARALSFQLGTALKFRLI